MLLAPPAAARVISIDKPNHNVSVLHETFFLEFYSMHSSGEAFRVQATGKTYQGDTCTWANPAVEFSGLDRAPSFIRTLSVPHRALPSPSSQRRLPLIP